MMQFILIALAVVAMMIAATLRVLWWFWTEHEEAVMRERLRQRANGGSAASWSEMQQRFRAKR